MRFSKIFQLYIRSTPHPVTVTTRIITFLVGNPYKPSFATVTGRGDNPNYIFDKLMACIFEALIKSASFLSHHDCLVRRLLPRCPQLP